MRGPGRRENSLSGPPLAWPCWCGRALRLSRLRRGPDPCLAPPPSAPSGSWKPIKNSLCPSRDSEAPLLGASGSFQVSPPKPGFWEQGPESSSTPCAAAAPGVKGPCCSARSSASLSILSVSGSEDKSPLRFSATTCVCGTSERMGSGRSPVCSVGWTDPPVGTWDGDDGVPASVRGGSSDGVMDARGSKTSCPHAAALQTGGKETEKDREGEKQRRCPS